MNETLLLAFLGLFVADYLLQTNDMAVMKKTDSTMCLIHCAWVSLAVWFFTGWGWLPCLLVGALHFVQDRTTIIAEFLKSQGREKFMEPPFAPWSLIVVDNVWHMVGIWFVWRFVA